MPDIETDTLAVSATQVERLRSGLKAWQSAESAANEAAEVLNRAKSDRDDKRDGLKKAVDELGEEEPSKEQEHQLSGLSRDWARSDRKFAECDREKRSRADHEKKVGARFLKVAIEIAEGQGDLYTKEVSSSDAWKGVPIADIVGDLQAMQLTKQAFHTIGDICTQHKRLNDLVRSGDVAKENALFVCHEIAETMHSRGLGRHLPDELRKMVGKARKVVPDTKPEKAEKAEKDNE